MIIISYLKPYNFFKKTNFDIKYPKKVWCVVEPTNQPTNL